MFAAYESLRQHCLNVAMPRAGQAVWLTAWELVAKQVAQDTVDALGSLFATYAPGYIDQDTDSGTGMR